MTNKQQGVASFSFEKRRETSVAGGKAAHAKGTAHRWDSKTASEAGKKGRGISRPRSRKEAPSAENL
ncbi:MAG: hypothetical protein AUF65_00900 [Chloroflexi bacterium 13_1_20CM_50_12]|nr:MAG: hypothetical protein AUF65_00900 [Chloroflexi bacterium 13_1_20CM_50_12]